MIKINKKVEYALMALRYILDKEGPPTQQEQALTSAREISDDLNIPFDTTAKVMQIMNNALILESIKGVKGGYKLNQDLAEVSFLSFAELIEGKKMGMDCVKLKCSLIETCNITGPIKKLNEYLALFFESLTLSDLLEKTSLLELQSLAQKPLNEVFKESTAIPLTSSQQPNQSRTNQPNLKINKENTHG